MSGLTNRATFPIACDSVVFAYDKGSLFLALIARKNPPFEGFWALPGGFLEVGETIEEGARRELLEETGIKHAYLETVKTYSDIDRDPRGRVISISFMALVKKDVYHLSASQDAAKVAWFKVSELPKLAFDHSVIIEDALMHLRKQTFYRPLGLELLPEFFSLGQMQTLYETILGCELDKRNFRKKIAKMDYVIDSGKKSSPKKHRPARLFTFDQEKYQAELKNGRYFL